MTMNVSSSWSSPHSGWHTNSQLSTEPFIPTQSNLQFVQLLNAKGIPDGFIAGFFSPNVVVDSMGRVLCVPSEQFDAIVELARQTHKLPDVRWRLKHERTCRDIRRLIVKIDEDVLEETSIYGYEKGREQLAAKTHGRTKLPSVLMELYGLLEEAGNGHTGGGADSSVIDAIKTLLKSMSPDSDSE